MSNKSYHYTHDDVRNMITALHHLSKDVHALNERLPQGQKFNLDQFKEGGLIPGFQMPKKFFTTDAMVQMLRPKGAWSHFQRDIIECARRVLREARRIRPSEQEMAEMALQITTITHFIEKYGVTLSNEVRAEQLTNEFKEVAFGMPPTQNKPSRITSAADAMDRWQQAHEHVEDPPMTQSPQFRAREKRKEQKRLFPGDDGYSLS